MALQYGDDLAGGEGIATLPENANLISHPVFARLLNASEDRAASDDEPRDGGIDDEEDEDAPIPPPPAPTGELTLAAICSPHLSWQRRLGLFAATVAVNVGLPFINGIMMGFGEIFARAFLAPWLGLTPPLLRPNLYSPSPADVPPLESVPPGGLRSWARGVWDRSGEKRGDVAHELE